MYVDESSPVAAAAALRPSYRLVHASSLVVVVVAAAATAVDS